MLVTNKSVPDTKVRVGIGCECKGYCDDGNADYKEKRRLHAAQPKPGEFRTATPVSNNVAVKLAFRDLNICNILEWLRAARAATPVARRR
jgi:hypothetical protein